MTLLLPLCLVVLINVAVESSSSFESVSSKHARSLLGAGPPPPRPTPAAPALPQGKMPTESPTPMPTHFPTPPPSPYFIEHQILGAKLMIPNPAFFPGEVNSCWNHTLLKFTKENMMALLGNDRVEIYTCPDQNCPAPDYLVEALPNASSMCTENKRRVPDIPQYKCKMHTSGRRLLGKGSPPPPPTPPRTKNPTPFPTRTPTLMPTTAPTNHPTPAPVGSKTCGCDHPYHDVLINAERFSDSLGLSNRQLLRWKIKKKHTAQARKPTTTPTIAPTTVPTTSPMNENRAECIHTIECSGGDPVLRALYTNRASAGLLPTPRPTPRAPKTKAPTNTPTLTPSKGPINADGPVSSARRSLLRKPRHKQQPPMQQQNKQKQQQQPPEHRDQHQQHTDQKHAQKNHKKQQSMPTAGPTRPSAAALTQTSVEQRRDIRLPLCVQHIVTSTLEFKATNVVPQDVNFKVMADDEDVQNAVAWSLVGEPSDKTLYPACRTGSDCACAADRERAKLADISLSPGSGCPKCACQEGPKSRGDSSQPPVALDEKCGKLKSLASAIPKITKQAICRTHCKLQRLNYWKAQNFRSAVQPSDRFPRTRNMPPSDYPFCGYDSDSMTEQAKRVSQNRCFDQIAQFGEDGAYQESVECASLVSTSCKESTKAAYCRQICKDRPRVGIHVCPESLIADCLTQLENDIQGSSLVAPEFSTKAERNSFSKANVTRFMRKNVYDAVDIAPRTPALLVDCQRSEQVMLQKHLISMCTQCNDDSPGIPAPLIRIGQPNPKVMWVCNTRGLLGVCEPALTEVYLGNMSRAWCTQIMEMHHGIELVMSELNRFPVPKVQLQQPTFQQQKNGFVWDFKDEKSVRIGIVSVLGWNTINCGLPTPNSAVSNMFAQSGFRIQSCTLTVSGAASCIDSKKSVCAKRSSPLTFKDCFARTTSSQIELFTNEGDRKSSSLLWLSTSVDCVQSDDDLLSFLSMS